MDNFHRHIGNFQLEVQLAVYGCVCFLTLVLYNVFLVMMLFGKSEITWTLWRIASDLLAVQNPYFLVAFSSRTREACLELLPW